MLSRGLHFLQNVLSVFDVSDDAVLVMDLQGVIQYANNIFLNRLNLARQHVVGAPFSLHQERLQVRFDEILSQLALDETSIRDIVCSDSRQKKKTYRMICGLLRDPDNLVRGVLVILSARNELLSAQLAHFADQRMLLTALNARRDEIITIIDVQNQLTVFASNSFTPMLGWRPEEIVEGGWPFEFVNFHPDDMNTIALVFYREMARRNLDPELDNQPILWEFRRRHRSGTWRWMRSESYVLERDARGQISHLISFEKDISVEKEDSHEAFRLVESLLEIPEKKPVPPLAKSSQSLSPREKQMIALLKEGLSAKEMAARLGLTLYTVNSYKKKLLSKLNAKNSAELVRIAIEQHFI